MWSARILQVIAAGVAATVAVVAAISVGGCDGGARLVGVAGVVTCVWFLRLLLAMLMLLGLLL